jgi:RNA-directed DNA polymerase
MAPRPRFEVPALPTVRALADWLRVSLDDLDWLADPRSLLARAPLGRLQHYTYHFLPKADGSRRLVEAPKGLLKHVQRRILHGILDRVPPHDAAHGFRAGRSVVTYAAPHAGRDLVLRMDLRQFFPSVGSARVAAIFRALGYPGPVAWELACLCTTRTPDAALDASLGPGAWRLRERHLPQGAPTSPALANLAAWRLDVRVAAAAARVGATYTRYADDLALSGEADFRRRAGRLRRLVVRIAEDEGFRVHWRKNRWMPPGVRQRLGGLVVNVRPRPSRADYDRLKATLHNCLKTGPAEQARGIPDLRAHLRGRVAWFELTDPPRGAKLRALFDRIAWPAPGAVTPPQA